MQLRMVGDDDRSRINEMKRGADRVGLGKGGGEG